MPRPPCRVLAAAFAASAGTVALVAPAHAATPEIRAADVVAVRTLAEKYGRASVHGRPSGAKACNWLTADAQRRFVEAQKATGPCPEVWDRAVAPARRTDAGRTARYVLLSRKPLRTDATTTPETIQRISIRIRSIVTQDSRTVRTVARIVFQRVDGVWKIDQVG
jgi:hypothetical protein